ncbi:MAG: TonB-dependent siderophore receptor [Pasteurellaceae bacterium]|nr:TonB-dependent siderophore receptor [Pasteurellaceae bacterium]
MRKTCAFQHCDRVMITSKYSHLFKFNAVLLALCSVSGLANAELSSTETNTSESLEQIDVSSQAEDRSTTEGSGSYTTDRMNTAIGLPLSIRETPQSVSVVSNKLIKDLNYTDLETALSYTAGIYVTKESGRSRLQSRGFYIDNIQEDGVANGISSSNMQRGVIGFSKESSDMAFYDRVEVLRGVAGLSQSNGDPGGTVNLLRKKPTKYFQANGSISAGSWDNYRNVVDASGPLNEAGTVRGRLIGVLAKTGEEKQNSAGNRRAVMGVLEFDVTDHTLLTVGALYQRSRGLYDIYGVPVYQTDGTTKSALNLSRKAYLGTDWSREILEKVNTFAEFEHRFNQDWKASVKFNYTHSNAHLVYGAIGGSNPYNPATKSHSLRRYRYDNGSDEVAFKMELNGKYELFGQKHDLFFNLSGSKEKFSNLEKRTADLYGYGLDFDRGSVAEPNWDDSSVLTYNDDYRSNIYKKAVTLGTRYNFNDSWHLLIGGRYSQVKYNRWLDDLLANEPYRYKVLKRQKFVPYAGLTWDYLPQHSWYLSYAEIFKPQSTTRSDGSYLEPIVGSNIETGLKSEFLDGRLNASLALFQVIQKNRAMTDPNNSLYSIAQGRVRTRGMDVELSGALSDNLQILAGYTYSRSIYLEQERTSSSVDYSKGALANRYTPRHVVRLYASYNLPDQWNKWTVGAGMRYQSQVSSIYRSSMVYYVPPQGGYTLWDANIAYQINKHMDVNLSVKNITDKKYWQNTSNRVAGMNNYYGEGRNATLTFNWNF